MKEETIVVDARAYAFKAACWDYAVRRGYLSERKIKEAREFAEAATKREG